MRLTTEMVKRAEELNLKAIELMSADDAEIDDKIVLECLKDPILTAMIFSGMSTQEGCKYSLKMLEVSQGASALELAVRTIEAEGSIADIWNIYDVKQHCEVLGVEELSDEDCMKVLRYIQEDHDANIGITYEVVEHAILRLIAEKSIRQKEE